MQLGKSQGTCSRPSEEEEARERDYNQLIKEHEKGNSSIEKEKAYQ